MEQNKSGALVSTRAVPLLGGWFAVLLGGVSLVGWFLQIPAIVKPSWSAKGIAFNTALSFVFAGLACILTVKGSRLAGRTFAALTALMPLATQFASLLGYELSIANWLHLPNPTQSSMAPFSALGLIAAAFVFLFAGGGGQRRLPLEAALSGAAVTPLVLGLIPAASAGLGLFDLTPWGPHFAAMSMMTALGLIALGGACLIIVLTPSRQSRERSSQLARPVAAIVAVALVSWALFDSVLTILQQREDRTTTIGRLARIGDAADALYMAMAQPDASAQIAGDYRALRERASGSQMAAPVDAMRTELDAVMALMQSGAAVPSTLHDRIAMDIGEVNREIAASIRAVSKSNPLIETVLRRDLIVSWLVCVGMIGIALLALFLELRKRLKVEAILRTNELNLQEKVERRTRELRATFEQAAVGLAHLSPQGVFIRVNDKLCQITGYSREELIGKSFGDITHAADLAADRERSHALVRGKVTTYSIEKRYLHRDGSVIWVSATRSLVRRPDGEPDYFIAVIEDITLRKTAEQMLQTSECRFRWVVESCPVGIVEVERPGEVILANQAFYNLIGWTPEDFAAEKMDLRRITLDDGHERTDEAIRKCVESGRAVIFEKEYLRRDGSRMPALVALSFNSELVREGVAFILDTSELKQAEQLLRESERRFRQVVEASSSAMIMVDTEGCIRLVNAQTEKLFGYDREEMIGRPVEMLVPERLRRSHAGHRGAFLESPEARAMGAGRFLFGLRKDGGEVPIEIGLNPVATPEGDFVLATIADITERKAAEAALRESARQLAQLADAMPQMVWTCYPDGSPEYRNRRWYEFLGLPRDASDLEMNQLVHPDDLKPMLEKWSSALSSGLPYDFQSRFWDCRSQTWRWHLNRALPIYETDGRLVKWVGTSTDIDDYRKLSGELERRVEMRTADLTKSLFEKELLLKEVHHRVKNNLQVICSLLSMQIHCADSDSTTASVASLEEAHQRVLSMAMVHEHLYRSEALKDLDFGEYARSLATRLFQVYGADPSRIRLELSVEAINLAIDQAIPSGLILNELITNALKYAFRDERAGVIRIVLRRSPGGRIELSVTDTGIGLPAGFDIKRVRSLGLQIIQALGEELDATLRISTGKGTSITFDWPSGDVEFEPSEVRF